MGPKKSLDQKIDFINENNNLARRIIKVGNRIDFNMTAGVDLPKPGKGYSSSFDIIGNMSPVKQNQIVQDLRKQVVSRSRGRNDSLVQSQNFHSALYKMNMR